MLRIAGWIKEDGVTALYGDVKHTVSVDKAKQHFLALFDALEIKYESNDADWFEVVIGIDDD